MTHPGETHRPHALRLDTDSDHDESYLRDGFSQLLLGQPSHASRVAKEHQHANSNGPGATPPINIPASHEEAFTDSATDSSSYIERYMRERVPSISFDHEVKLEEGIRVPASAPLEKPVKNRVRGRSLLQAVAEGYIEYGIGSG